MQLQLSIDCLYLAITYNNDNNSSSSSSLANKEEDNNNKLWGNLMKRLCARSPPPRKLLQLQVIHYDNNNNNKIPYTYAVNVSCRYSRRCRDCNPKAMSLRLCCCCWVFAVDVDSYV
uniref:Uncharacterized protein n=1 Tax=Glossina pallidipes TaxID=7398 RepID=A0A1A9ZNB6_GLOPL